jgi:beta-glucosidase
MVVAVTPGESKQITVAADPRLLARFDGQAGRWRIVAGNYRVALGKSANHPVLNAEVQLPMRVFGV